MNSASVLFEKDAAPPPFIHPNAAAERITQKDVPCNQRAALQQHALWEIIAPDCAACLVVRVDNPLWIF